MSILARPLMLWLVLAMAAPAWAAPSVVGTVVSAADGRPLAGATVSVKGRSPALRIAVEATAADGRFAVDPSAVLDAEALQSRALTLVVERQGFRPWSRKIITGTPGEFAWQGEAALVPAGGLAALSEQERARLERFRSTTGRTLMMLPYELVALAEAPPEDAFNTLLRRNLHRGIKSYLQRPDYEEFAEGVGIEALDVPVTSTSTERLVALGRYLRALGVIAGDAVVTAGGEGEAVITLSSGYHVIPEPSEDMIAEIGVDDRLRLSELASMQVSEILNPVWGRATLIAVSLTEMQAAREAGDLRRLERVLGYVRSERDALGPGNNDYEAEILALVEALEAAIEEVRAR